MELRFVLEGDEALMATFGRLAALTRGTLAEQALASGAQLILNAAKEKVPYRTGTLRRSLHIETSSTGTMVEATVGTDMEYAAQREYGGTIRPKNKKFLHWVDSEGNDVFAREVTQAAQPYLRPAFDEQRDAAVDEAGMAFKALVLAAATGS